MYITENGIKLKSFFQEEISFSFKINYQVWIMEIK